MHWISFFLLFSSQAHAALTPDEEKAYDELEGSAYLVRLVKDAKFAEALDAARGLSVGEREKAQSAWAIGEAHGGLGDWKKARDIFKRANLLPSLGHAYFKLNDFSACVRTFKQTKIQQLIQRDVLAWFQCAEKSQQGLAQLALATKPQNEDVFFAQFKALRKVGLHLVAQDALNGFTQQCRPANFYARLNELAEKEAINLTIILEQAHACHPQDKDVTLLLLQTHYKAQRGLTVTRLFEQLALGDISYHHHVAEFRESLAQKESAVYWRVTTPDREALLKARAALWVNEGQWGHTIALASLDEQKLLDDPLRYATGYAFFKLGFTGPARKALEGIKGASVAPQVKKLLELTHVCEKQGWACRP